VAVRSVNPAHREKTHDLQRSCSQSVRLHHRCAGDGVRWGPAGNGRLGIYQARSRSPLQLLAVYAGYQETMIRLFRRYHPPLEAATIEARTDEDSLTRLRWISNGTPR